MALDEFLGQGRLGHVEKSATHALDLPRFASNQPVVYLQQQLGAVAPDVAAPDGRQVLRPGQLAPKCLAADLPVRLRDEVPH